MYLEHFKLLEMPYKTGPNPRFLYMTPQHQEALGMCQLTIKDKAGLVVVYGEVGMGKTTIARKLADDLIDEGNTQVAALITPALKTETALLRAIMDEFGVPVKRSYYLSLQAFQEYILDEHDQGNNLVVIIDEAQKLTPRMLDVLHTLLNFESNTEKYLQIVLMGQKELAANIDKVYAIKSRVSVFGELQNLTQDDTADMVAFRWHTASGGKSSHPFSSEALEAIYSFSDGLPREICKLCHEGLLRAFDSGSHEVSKQMIEEGAAALRLSANKETK